MSLRDELMRVLGEEEVNRLLGPLNDAIPSAAPLLGTGNPYVPHALDIKRQGLQEGDLGRYVVGLPPLPSQGADISVSGNPFSEVVVDLSDDDFWVNGNNKILTIPGYEFYYRRQGSHPHGRLIVDTGSGAIREFYPGSRIKGKFSRLTLSIQRGFQTIKTTLFPAGGTPSAFPRSGSAVARFVIKTVDDPGLAYIENDFAQVGQVFPPVDLLGTDSVVQAVGNPGYAVGATYSFYIGGSYTKGILNIGTASGSGTVTGATGVYSLAGVSSWSETGNGPPVPTVGPLLATTSFNGVLQVFPVDLTGADFFVIKVTALSGAGAILYRPWLIGVA